MIKIINGDQLIISPYAAYKKITETCELFNFLVDLISIFSINMMWSLKKILKHCTTNGFD